MLVPVCVSYVCSSIPQVLPSADLVTAAHQAVDTWSPLANHPNIVPLRSTFVSAEVEGSSSLYFVYDYMPGECVCVKT